MILVILYNVLIIGREGRKYPLFGLTEIGNYRVRNPQNGVIEMAIDDPEVAVTYLQQYTPLNKPLTTQGLWKDHPFLLSYLLNLDFIQSNARFGEIWAEVDNMRDFQSLREAASNCLYPAVARLEFVVCCRSPTFLQYIGFNYLKSEIRDNKLLIEVS